MTEAAIMRAIMAEAPKHGARLFRNNVGQAWAGKLQQRSSTHTEAFCSAVIIDPYPVHFGLCEGSSDLIGWMPVHWDATILDAIFLAVEVKTPRGRVSKEQQAFIDAVNKAGGIAGVCRSVEDFVELIK
jgi:hypothetical protein